MESDRLEAFSDGVFAVAITLLALDLAVPGPGHGRLGYLLRGHFDASLATAIYQGVFEGMSLSFGILFWWAIRHEHLKIALTPAAAKTAVIRFGIGNVGYIAAVGVAFVRPVASLAISALVAIYYIFEQTPARSSAPAAPDDPGNPGDPAATS